MAIVKDKARLDALPIGRFQPNLLVNANTTGEGQHYLPGEYEWLIWGVWDGATATLQQAPDIPPTSWVSFNAGTATENGRLTGIPISKSFMRVQLTNVGVNTRLNSSFNRVNDYARY